MSKILLKRFHTQYEVHHCFFISYCEVMRPFLELEADALPTVELRSHIILAYGAQNLTPISLESGSEGSIH